jgi:hypothetical protein
MIVDDFSDFKIANAHRDKGNSATCLKQKLLCTSRTSTSGEFHCCDMTERKGFLQRQWGKKGEGY